MGMGQPIREISPPPPPPSPTPARAWPYLRKRGEICSFVSLTKLSLLLCEFPSGGERLCRGNIVQDEQKRGKEDDDDTACSLHNNGRAATKQGGDLWISPSSSSSSSAKREFSDWGRERAQTIYLLPSLPTDFYLVCRTFRVSRGSHGIQRQKQALLYST